MSLEIIGDFALMATLVGLVAGAIVLRRDPDAHKRLMTVASISIAAPAIVRWPGVAAHAPLSIVGPQLGLDAALIAYDLVSIRRVHRATIWAVVGCVVLVGASVLLAASPIG